LYFYPKDFTSVCTAEACGFRENFAFFEGLDVPVLGVSRDDLATHHRFREAHELPFHLLADTKGAVSKQYGANIPFVNMTRRITYLLDADHRVAGVLENMFSARRHIDEMIAQLKRTSSAG
ncbi:MAG: peroxiredoxin, partial [Catalinimonas sp.]